MKLFFACLIIYFSWCRLEAKPKVIKELEISSVLESEKQAFTVFRSFGEHPVYLLTFKNQKGRPHTIKLSFAQYSQIRARATRLFWTAPSQSPSQPQSQSKPARTKQTCSQPIQFMLDSKKKQICSEDRVIYTRMQALARVLSETEGYLPQRR